jgi:hypothetical protein
MASRISEWRTMCVSRVCTWDSDPRLTSETRLRRSRSREHQRCVPRGSGAGTPVRVSIRSLWPANATFRGGKVCPLPFWRAAQQAIRRARMTRIRRTTWAARPTRLFMACDTVQSSHHRSLRIEETGSRPSTPVVPVFLFSVSHDSDSRKGIRRTEPGGRAVSNPPSMQSIERATETCARTCLEVGRTWQSGNHSRPCTKR